MASRPAHLRLLDQLTLLLGATRHVPRVLFPHPWVSKAGWAAQALNGLFSLCALTLNPARKILVCGTGPSLLEGEVIVTDSLLPVRAWACLRARRPFVALPTHAERAVSFASERLGMDALPELHAYLSLNALLIIFGERGGRPVVVHVAAAPTGGEALARHHTGLHVAAAARVPRGTRDVIPETIEYGRRGGMEILVQSRRPGVARRIGIGSDVDLFRDIDCGLAMLLTWRASGEHTEIGPDHELLYAEMPRALAACAELKDVLWPVLFHVQAWQSRHKFPGMLTHGDFWLRNILFDQSGAVSGIVDWERARARGTPGLDALHLAMMSLAMNGGHDVIRYIRQAWSGEWESDFLARYVGTVRAEFGLDNQDIQCLAGLLLIDEIHKLHSVGRRLSPSRCLRFKALAPAIGDWLRI